MTPDAKRKAVWCKVFADCDDWGRKKPRYDSVAALAKHYGCHAETFEQWRRESRMFRGATDCLIGVPNTAHLYAPRESEPVAPPEPTRAKRHSHSAVTQRVAAAQPTAALARTARKPPPWRAAPDSPLTSVYVAEVVALPGTYRSIAALCKAFGDNWKSWENRSRNYPKVRAAMQAKLIPRVAASSQ